MDDIILECILLLEIQTNWKKWLWKENVFEPSMCSHLGQWTWVISSKLMWNTLGSIIQVNHLPFSWVQIMSMKTTQIAHPFLAWMPTPKIVQLFQCLHPRPQKFHSWIIHSMIAFLQVSWYKNIPNKLQ